MKYQNHILKKNRWENILWLGSKGKMYTCHNQKSDDSEVCGKINNAGVNIKRTCLT